MSGVIFPKSLQRSNSQGSGAVGADRDYAPSLIEQSSEFGPAARLPQVQVWVARYVYFLAACTIFLMALGSATRVMNAGLSCPDWPLCYGSLIPSSQMNLQVFLEWFHRVVATSMGIGTLALVGLAFWQRQALPGWFPKAALGALALVIGQGILGGLTVTEMLRFEVVTSHLATGLLFFSTLLAIATSLAPQPHTQSLGTARRLRWVGLGAVLLVYGQSLLGGLVASRWALHQCFGTAQLCGVMNSHIAGILPASLATVVVLVTAWRTPALAPGLRRWAETAGGLLLLQITLGVATFRLHLQVQPLTVCHQMIGACLLGSLVMFTVLAWRDSPRLATAARSVDTATA
jgi:heme a synthase